MHFLSHFRCTREKLFAVHTWFPRTLFPTRELHKIRCISLLPTTFHNRNTVSIHCVHSIALYFHAHCDSKGHSQQTFQGFTYFENEARGSLLLMLQKQSLIFTYNSSLTASMTQQLQITKALIKRFFFSTNTGWENIDNAAL